MNILATSFLVGGLANYSAIFGREARSSAGGLHQMLILAGSLALLLRISKVCSKHVHRNNVLENKSTVGDRV
jgi:hypothetical protein